METESVRSGFSDQSLRSKSNSRHASRSGSHRNAGSHSRSTSRYGTTDYHRLTYFTHLMILCYVSRTIRSDRNKDIMSPYQTTVSLEDGRSGQDVVEVQILPQVNEFVRVSFEVEMCFYF